MESTATTLLVQYFEKANEISPLKKTVKADMMVKVVL